LNLILGTLEIERVKMKATEKYIPVVLLTFEPRDEFLKPLKSRDKFLFLKFIILMKDSVRTVSVADPGGGLT